MNRKKVFLLSGYFVVNVLVMVTCIRALGRMISALGMVNVNMGEVLSYIWALLLPSPF